MNFLLLISCLSVFVFVVYGADNGEFGSQSHPEVAIILDRASAVREKFSASLAEVMDEGFTAAGESSTRKKERVDRVTLNRGQLAFHTLINKSVTTYDGEVRLQQGEITNTWSSASELGASLSKVIDEAHI